MNPGEVRKEILRLEEERRRLAPKVMGGNPAAFEKDKHLEGRIRGLAKSEREARSGQLMEAWRRNHPGGRT